MPSSCSAPNPLDTTFPTLTLTADEEAHRHREFRQVTLLFHANPTKNPYIYPNKILPKPYPHAATLARGRKIRQAKLLFYAKPSPNPTQTFKKP